jgi:hypothetical protein
MAKQRSRARTASRLSRRQREGCKDLFYGLVLLTAWLYYVWWTLPYLEMPELIILYIMNTAIALIIYGFLHRGYSSLREDKDASNVVRES